MVSPLMPAKAGIQFLALGPRFRGDERWLSLGLPYPPAVGVWMISASPASITVASQPLSNSIEPSLRRTEFCPT